MTGPRVAIYGRVSTDEQDADSQLATVRAFAAGLEPAELLEFVETGSGARSDRKLLGAMMACVDARRVDVVVVWALDRLSRGGVLVALSLVERMRAAGVRFVSVTESDMDTGTATGEVMFSLRAAFARMERERIAARVRAGMARVLADGNTGAATKTGRPVGRPSRVAEADARAWRSLCDAGVPAEEAAARVGFPVRTLRRAVAERWPALRRGQGRLF